MSQTTERARPIRYSEQIAAAICWELAEGQSLRAICKRPDMPYKDSVTRWLEKHESFRRQYARARELQAHALAEEALEIADDGTGDSRIVDGKREIDYENIHRSRLRVDARRWMAGKLLPKVYGDKLLHTGADGEGPVAVKLALDYSLLAPDELLTLRRLLLKATPAPAAAPLQIEGEVIEDAEK